MAATGSTSPSATRTAAPPKASWLLVMPLRAALEHVLVLVGDADISTADQLRDQLLDAVALRPVALRVELGGLDFCDLHGLDALHDAARAAAAARVPLTFTGMSPQLAWMQRTFPPAGSAETGAAGPGAPALPASPGTGAEQTYRAGTGGGRRVRPDGLLHAVPVHDTTCSSVCGARVQRSPSSWDASRPDSCPECTALLTPDPAASPLFQP